MPGSSCARRSGRVSAWMRWSVATGARPGPAAALSRRGHSRHTPRRTADARRTAQPPIAATNRSSSQSPPDPSDSGDSGNHVEPAAGGRTGSARRGQHRKAPPRRLLFSFTGERLTERTAPANRRPPLLVHRGTTLRSGSSSPLSRRPGVVAGHTTAPTPRSHCAAAEPSTSVRRCAPVQDGRR